MNSSVNKQSYIIGIRGIVQGVGFRPFIYRLAEKYGINGTVANTAEGVLINVSCLRDPEVKEFACKYTTRSQTMSHENQAQLWRHIGDIAISGKGGCSMFGALHGGGSPRMESIAITSQYDIEERKAIVRKVAGMKEE